MLFLSVIVTAVVVFFNAIVIPLIAYAHCSCYCCCCCSWPPLFVVE